MTIDSLTSNWNTIDKINADTYKIMLPIQKCRLSIRKNKKQNIVNSWNQQYWHFHRVTVKLYRLFQSFLSNNTGILKELLPNNTDFSVFISKNNDTFTDLKSNNTDFSVFISNNNDTFTELKSHNTNFSVFIYTGNFLRVTVNLAISSFRGLLSNKTDSGNLRKLLLKKMSTFFRAHIMQYSHGPKK